MADKDDTYTVRRKRKHSAAQPKSVARRKAKGSPGRDDLDRAAYYTLLALYRDPVVDKALRASLQRQVMVIMGRAGFGLIEANGAFLKDAASLPANLKGWLYRRGKQSIPASEAV